MGRLPDFIIIGAMKSGTTSLHYYLDISPGNIHVKSKIAGFLQQ